MPKMFCFNHSDPINGDGTVTFSQRNGQWCVDVEIGETTMSWDGFETIIEAMTVFKNECQEAS